MISRNILEISQLSKSYGDIHAVQNISFSVKEGALFAFLGINGAGKSTTISILCGKEAKDSGRVIVGGYDLDRDISPIKDTIGVVFQNSVLDRPLTVYDNLKSRAALYGIYGHTLEERVRELCELLALDELLHRPVGKLSGGQRRRADIARALLHRPRILILDEPTTGLDPGTRKLLWNAIASLRRERGMTVFLTTHYMEEAADADDIVILDAGRIIAHGTPLELKNRYTHDYITLYGVDEAELQALELPYEAIPGAIRISIPNTAAATDLIMAHPSCFRDYEIIKGRMDDVFLSATGKSLHVDLPKDTTKKGGRGA